MKIGILTFQRVHNYGALLQAYAMLSFLKKLGHNVEFVDYWPKYHSQHYDLIPDFWNRNFLSKLKGIFLLCIGFFSILKRRKKYLNFIHHHLFLQKKPKYLSKNELKNLPYDLIIYGSDQIWRRYQLKNFKGFDEVYFGEFPQNPCIKISYAASMGILDFQPNEAQQIQQWLHNFNAISVRELELQQHIEKFFHIPCSFVLDPVFLLPKEEWLSLCKSISITKNEKYIFFYNILPSTDATMFANFCEKHTGYKIIEVRGRANPLLIGSRYKHNVGPIEFLSLIKNAEIVLSTSFHGTAFAILFEKEFYCVGMKKNNMRIQSLLESLNLNNRFSENFDPTIFSSQKINYNMVKTKLYELRQQSLNFLKLHINENKF